MALLENLMGWKTSIKCRLEHSSLLSFCSAWISSHELAMGTNYNRLFVLDLIPVALTPIPLPESGNPLPAETAGMHIISTNQQFSPTQPLMATGEQNPCEYVTFYCST